MHVKRLFNQYEEITYSKLREVAEPYGTKVFGKVRLKDVLPVDGSGISQIQYGFALKSHVDCLIVDENYLPLFAVEYDGPSHQDERQKQRDKIKNDLFVHFGFPFLRINSNYLNNKFRGYDLLTYFIEAYFLREAFGKSYEQGQLPDDEDFDLMSIYSDGTIGGKRWPYQLALEKRRRIWQLFEKGIIASTVPNHIVCGDNSGNMRCYAYLCIDRNRWVSVHTGMKGHLFPAVHISELIAEIACFDLSDALDKVLNGQQPAQSGEVIDSTIKRYKDKFELRSSLSGGFR